MKFTALQENLHPALRSTLKAISSKPPLLILNSILLTAQKGGITAAATDLYLGISSSVPGKVEQTGTALVPAKLFAESVRSLPAGRLELFLEDDTLHIKHANGTTKLQCQQPTDFPEFPTPSGERHHLKPALIDDISRYVSFSVSQDPTRQVLTTLLLEPVESGLRVVGTDGFRLSVLESQGTSLELDDDQTILLPARAFNEIAAVVKQGSEDGVELMVSEQLKHLFLKTQDLEVSARLVDGQFPPYRKIIPNGFELELTLEVAEVMEQVKRALVFAREASNIVTWQFDKDVLTISAQATGQGVFEGKVSLEKKLPSSAKIAFNGRYLHDLFSHLTAEQVWFGMNDSLKPAAFKEVGNDSFTHVIMPFRLND